MKNSTITRAALIGCKSAFILKRAESEDQSPKSFRENAGPVFGTYLGGISGLFAGHDIHSRIAKPVKEVRDMRELYKAVGDAINYKYSNPIESLYNKAWATMFTGGKKPSTVDPKFSKFIHDMASKTDWDDPNVKRKASETISMAESRLAGMDRVRSKHYLPRARLGGLAGFLGLTGLGYLGGKGVQKVLENHLPGEE